MEKKSNKGLIVTLIIVIILFIALAGYVVYDKCLINIGQKEEKTETKEEKVKEEELDINSRLVRNLYNKVSVESDMKYWYRFWYYSDINLETTEGLEDFSKDESSEIVKMQLVVKNLTNENKKLISCEKYNIPDNAPNTDLPMQSKCYDQKINNINYANLEYGYEKDYIESIYKDLFGSDAKLDTDIPMYVGVHKNEAYYYIPELDMYIDYILEGGGTSGPGGYTTKLEKAIKTRKEIKIYELVDKYGYDENKEETFTFVYTFEQDDDGMYNFISRVKES